MTALHDLGVRDAARAIAGGALGAERLAAALLERAAAHAHLGAFITLDADQVRSAAREADRQQRQGRRLGPLHGVPLAIKDNIDVIGLPTTAGTPGLADHWPSRDAALVARLAEAGALVLGKTNMHELAFGITSNNATYGPARNPHAPERIAGGSSGGTAAAVAARVAPGGIGTDTGGSIRIPAALCGLVGFRPSMGRWPQAGIVPISHTRDAAGPMTRSVADAALLDAVVSGEANEVVPPPLAGLRIGVPLHGFWENLDGEVGAVCAAVLRRWTAAGVRLVEVDLAEALRLEAVAGFPIALHEVVGGLDRYLAEHGCGVDFAALAERVASPDVRALLGGLVGADAIPEEQYRAALAVHRPALQALYARTFREHDLAALAFPTTPAPACLVGDDESFPLGGRRVPTFATFIRNTSPATVAGLPGLSLPAGTTAGGLPVGIELDGPAGSDRALLALAEALEAVPT